ncbi:MAG: DUF4157 domain-containing protein [Gilvibacter sp.]
MKAASTASKNDTSSKNGTSAKFFNKDSSAESPTADTLFFAPIAIQRKTADAGSVPVANSNIESKINQSKGRGQAMDKGTNAAMSSSFGTDFSHVSIHTDETAVQLSQDLGAKAFTTGNDIYFNRGQYDPSSKSGQKLLAHELTHTVQQEDSGMIQKYDHTVVSRDTLGGLSARYGVTEAQIRASNRSIPANGTIQLGQRIWIPVREHTVVNGDTLGGLARTYSTTEANIRRANGLTTSRIRIGQVLVIPGFHAPSRNRPTTSPTPAPGRTPAPTPTPTRGVPPLPTGLLTANPAEILSSSQRRRLRYANSLVRTFDTWSQTQINTYVARLRTRIAASLRTTLISRVRLLVTFRSTMRTTLIANLAQGDDFLTLANIIYNEAGVFGPNAHAAVAYAWLNRNGGNVAANRGASLSGYVRLSTRWASFRRLGQKLTFVEHFPSALTAANRVLNDRNRSANDPTGGATHWVSPQGLPAYNPASPAHVRERYSRTYQGHRNRGFPNWAIANNDTARLRAARTGRNAIINSNYREVVVRGIPGAQFLFYRGVK